MENQVLELQRKLRETEKTLLQSAQHGKNLLEENAQLKKNLQTEKLIISEKIETLEQERYSLSIRLKASQKSEEALRDELEATRDLRSQELDVQMEELVRDNGRLTQRLRQLEADLVEGASDRTELQARLDHLTYENEALLAKTAAAATSAVVSDGSTVVLDLELWRQVEQDVEDSKQQEKILMEMVEFKDKQLEEVRLNETNLHEHIAELQDRLKDKESKLVDYIKSTDQYRDDIADLQIQLQSACLREADPNRRGNSLFSEVEDHRQRLERHLNSLRIKYDAVCKEKENNVSRINSLQLQVAGMAAAARGKANASHVEHLEIKLAQVQSELRMRINREENSAKVNNLSPVLTTSAATTQPKFGDQTGFLTVMLRQSKSKVDELEKECKALQLKCMSESEQGRQVRHDLLNAEQTAADIWAENLRLKMKLEDIQRKHGEYKENITVKVIEKINTDGGDGGVVATRLKPKAIAASQPPEKDLNRKILSLRVAPVTNEVDTVRTERKSQSVVTISKEKNDCNQQ